MTLPHRLTNVGDIPVTWVGAFEGNQWRQDGGLHESSCEGVVEHIMEGTLAGCDSWFNLAGTGASANFGISKAGEIHQYVELYGVAPYANGVSQQRPDKVAVMDALVRQLSAQYGWVSQNWWTWSIEHEGMTGEQITDFPKMFDASTRLTALLLGDLPETRRRTFGHYQFDNIDRPKCPGWSTETWTAYDNRVKELLSEAQPEPAPSPDLAGARAALDDVWAMVFRQHDEIVGKLSDVYTRVRERFPDF